MFRHRAAVSTVADITKGGFQHIIDDPAGPDPGNVERLVFCSGKVFYDLLEARRANETTGVAIIRIEELYPFPIQAYREVLRSVHFVG